MIDSSDFASPNVGASLRSSRSQPTAPDIVLFFDLRDARRARFLIDAWAALGLNVSLAPSDSDADLVTAAAERAREAAVLIGVGEPWSNPDVKELLVAFFARGRTVRLITTRPGRPINLPIFLKAYPIARLRRSSSRGLPEILGVHRRGASAQRIGRTRRDHTPLGLRQQGDRASTQQGEW